MKRRNFIKATTASGLVLSAPYLYADGHGGKPKVVVIGGGAGGATAARYIAKDSDGAIEVTLIEPKKTYYTCFFSNLYLGGFRTIDSLAHSYEKLGSEYGINVVHDYADGVDPTAKTVTLRGGDVIPYDHLVISPGIDFVEGSVAGWSEVDHAEIMPHAYHAGAQTELLKAQLEAMPEGGVFAMIAPPNPYRCPPGPYERISMVAHYLKNNNPTAKIIVADPKEKFSKMALFQEGWAKHYNGMIDWIGPEFGGGNVEVRPDTMEVIIDGEVTKADVVNVIPGQKAGAIADAAGVTVDGWAPVDPHTMATRANADITVLGDASNQGDMPKSGFSANSQAKVAAMAIRGKLTDSKVFPAKYSNTCWSLITTDDGIKVGANYEATDEKIASMEGFVSETGEGADLRKATYEESIGWYEGITADMFG